MAREDVEQTLTTPSLLILDVHAVGLDDKQFFRLCRDNRDFRMELTAHGELIIMPPTGSKTGWRNAKIIHRLTAWAEKEGSGVTFDSSTGFTLPNGAKRSPDAAWVRRERWEALTEEEQEGFAPLCPDFVLELRSSADSLTLLQEKMREYMANGAQLGWLIDPTARRIYVSRQEQPPACLENPETIRGDPVLQGFILDMHDIW